MPKIFFFLLLSVMCLHTQAINVSKTEYGVNLQYLKIVNPNIWTLTLEDSHGQTSKENKVSICLYFFTTRQRNFQGSDQIKFK